MPGLRFYFCLGCSNINILGCVQTGLCKYQRAGYQRFSLGLRRCQN